MNPLDNTSAEICIFPLGVGDSLSPSVAACVRTLRQYESQGLTMETHANGTNLYGPMPVVLEAIQACHEVLHQAEVPRVISQVKLSTRKGPAQTADRKMASLQEQLERTS